MKPGPKVFLLPPTLLLGGCELAAHAPTVDVIGSYFPAWMVCILAGLLLTLVTRWLLMGMKLHVYVHPKGIVYPCLLLAFTLATWLVFFQN